MPPLNRPRKPRNSSKVNLLISFLFHTIILTVAFYFAARGGLLGTHLKKIAVEMVKEKAPEKPKEPLKPKSDLPKADISKQPPKMQMAKTVQAPTVPPPAVGAPTAPPTVAPPAAVLPAFEFSGGKAVETTSDPIELYRGLLQFALTSKWNKPEDIADDHYVDEVDVSVDAQGRISNPQWLKRSGNNRWDDSVRAALAAVNKLDRPPPRGFPSHVVVRFDVQELTEPLVTQ
jgi:TonB C terminal